MSEWFRAGKSVKQQRMALLTNRSFLFGTALFVIVSFWQLPTILIFVCVVPVFPRGQAGK